MNPPKPKQTASPEETADRILGLMDLSPLAVTYLRNNIADAIREARALDFPTQEQAVHEARSFSTNSDSEVHMVFRLGFLSCHDWLKTRLGVTK